jgi:hypothetical protein
VQSSSLSKIKHVGSGITVADLIKTLPESICHCRCRSCAILLTNGQKVKYLDAFVV